MMFLSKKRWLLILIGCTYSMQTMAATVDVTTYGAVGNGSSNDTNSIKLAVANLTDYDVLLFPKTSAYYKIDVDADLTIDNIGIRVVIQGRIETTGTPSQDKHLFKVTAADCQFVGEGGQAVIDGSGSYYSSPHDDGPSLIRIYGISAARSLVDNIRFVDAPCYGVSVQGVEGARIQNCIFEGGPTSSSTSHLSGIFLRGADYVSIRDCVFQENTGGGVMDQWIRSSSTSSSHYVLIRGNKFDSAYHQAINGLGLFRSIVSVNTIDANGGDASAIVMRGKRNVVSSNVIYNASGGGIHLLNPVQCIVAGNTIHGYKKYGIQLTEAGTNTDAWEDNQIMNNTIHAAESGVIYHGIRVVGNASASIDGMSVVGNNIVGGGQSSGTSAIQLDGQGVASYGCVVMGNIVDDCGNEGLEVNYVNRSLIADNIIQVPTGQTPIVSSNVVEANTSVDNIEKVY